MKALGLRPRGHARGMLLSTVAVAALCGASPAQAAPPPPNQVVVVPRPDGATTYNVQGVNYDGSVIFGGASYGTPNRPFVWKGGAASTDLGAFISPVTSQPYTFNGMGAIASNAVSDDGRVIVGTSSSSGTPARAWIWTDGVGYQDLGLPAGFGGVSAFAVSRDGKTVVGLTSLNQGNAFRWRAATGYEILGVPAIQGQTFSGTSALGTNGDGSVIVGFASRTVPTSISLPFIWREGSGFEIIQTGYGTGAGQARAVSADGTIVGGRAMTNASNERIFRRDAAGTIFLIVPVAGDTWTEFRGMSADGAKIVGISGNDTPANGRQAILWTTTDGTRTLNAIAAAANIPNAGLDLRLASAISGDGTTIVGTGRNASGTDLPFALRLVTLVHVPTLSRSLTQLIVPDAILQNIRTTTYDTGVVGLLNGTQVYGERFDEMTSGPGVQQGFVDAADAIRDAAGVRRVTIDAPVNTRSETQTVAVSGPVETQIIETLPDQANVYTTQGPATIATGDRGICSNPGDGTAPPSGCSLPGTPMTITDTQINDNTHTASFERITRVLTTTTEDRLYEDWSVAGTLGTQIGTVHAIAGLAALDTGDRFTRRLLAARYTPTNGGSAKVAGDVWPNIPGAPYVAILEGYGVTSNYDGDAANGVQSVSLDGSGLTAALAYDVAPSVTIGLGGEISRRDADIQDPLFPERLDADTLQGGIFALFRQSRISAAAAASGGRSAIDTRISDAGGIQSASYDATIWSAAFEAGYDIPLAKKFTLTPIIGAAWQRAELDAFAEHGASPNLLIGKGTALDATRAWAGLRAGATFQSDDGALYVPSVYARYVRRDGDFDAHADVAFAGDPTHGLIARGPHSSPDGIEVGAALAVVGTDSTSLSVGYDGAFADGRDTHEFKATLTVHF